MTDTEQNTQEIVVAEQETGTAVAAPAEMNILQCIMFR